jgi:hypothetical protein
MWVCAVATPEKVETRTVQNFQTFPNTRHAGLDPVSIATRQHFDRLQFISFNDFVWLVSAPFTQVDY